MGIKLLYKIDDEQNTTIVRIEPLCAGAEVKCKDRILGKGEKNSFIALPGKGGSEQANALKTVPLLGKNFEEFYSKKKKKKKTGFQIGVRIGTNMHFSFFGGILVIKAGVRRSRPDHDGGLLGYCLE